MTATVAPAADHQDRYVSNKYFRYSSDLSVSKDDGEVSFCVESLCRRLKWHLSLKETEPGLDYKEDYQRFEEEFNHFVSGLAESHGAVQNRNTDAHSKNRFLRPHRQNRLGHSAGRDPSGQSCYLYILGTEMHRTKLVGKCPECLYLTFSGHQPLHTYFATAYLESFEHDVV